MKSGKKVPPRCPAGSNDESVTCDRWSRSYTCPELVYILSQTKKYVRVDNPSERGKGPRRRRCCRHRRCGTHPRQRRRGGGGPCRRRRRRCCHGSRPWRWRRRGGGPCRCRRCRRLRLPLPPLLAPRVAIHNRCNCWRAVVLQSLPCSPRRGDPLSSQRARQSTITVTAESRWSYHCCRLYLAQQASVVAAASAARRDSLSLRLLTRGGPTDGGVSAAHLPAAATLRCC